MAYQQDGAELCADVGVSARGKRFLQLRETYVNSIFNPGQKGLEPMTNIGSILGEYGGHVFVLILLNPGLVSQKTGAECVQQRPPSASAPPAWCLSTKCS